MHTYTATITIKSADALSCKRVAELVNKLLDVGYADAQETATDPDFENPMIQEVVGLSFGWPQVTKGKP